jgi:hypothetical protein
MIPIGSLILFGEAVSEKGRRWGFNAMPKGLFAKWNDTSYMKFSEGR